MIQQSHLFPARTGEKTGGTTMFRKLLSAITSTAVVAGLVTAGAVAGTVATAAPAAAAFDPSTPNPGLPGKCGLSFGLVLDSSGSIGQDPGMKNLISASNAFVDSLVDTGSTVAVTSFLDK
ncbi:MAG: hypothetical protein V9G09_12015 [Candidatus Nanopelagicales bacterium]